jgi:hypothetical protein
MRRRTAGNVDEESDEDDETELKPKT